jgi:hypothetical protein
MPHAKRRRRRMEPLPGGELKDLMTLTRQTDKEAAELDVLPLVVLSQDCVAPDVLVVAR